MSTRPLLLAAVAIVLAACGNGKTQQDPVRPVVTQTVVPGAAAARDIYSGEVRARYETDLGFRVGGKLVARVVDAGARVTRGQVLARLDPEDARLAAQGAAAQLASAESDFALAKVPTRAPPHPARQAVRRIGGVGSRGSLGQGRS